MKPIFDHHPSIDPKFQHQLRQTVLSSFKHSLKPFFPWRLLLPLAVSLGVLAALFINFSPSSPTKIIQSTLTSLKSSRDIAALDAELTTLEAELVNDADLTAAINFENL